MDNPKISVLIPMYNRKHYIEQCINSALSQTFQDYEIVIRDNRSTDGGYEFVKEKYAQQISEGKIRLYLNKENIGLMGSTKFLINDAAGKYILFLHSDDMILNQALAHLYEVAEKTSADVVHSSFFYNSPSSGIINDISDCKIRCCEKTVFDKVTIMPNEPLSRFQQWFYGGIFWDAQYNFFKKEFVIQNEIFIDEHDYCYSALWWIMLAKVLVKTPSVYYVRRDCPDSGTRELFSAELFEACVSDTINSCKDFDKLFSKMAFFRDNEFIQYMTKAHYVSLVDSFQILGRKAHQNGMTPHLYEITAKVFKKYFGELNYFYPMFLFNWVHIMPFGQHPDTISLIDKNAPPPRIGVAA